MEVHIGVQHAAKEVVLTIDSTPEKITAAVEKAFAAGSLLSLQDHRGRTVLIPVERLAYVELGPAEERRVGFAAAE